MRDSRPQSVAGILTQAHAAPQQSARHISAQIGPLRGEWNDIKAAVLVLVGEGRATSKAVPESSDFVMYWWHHAADLVRAGKLARFGFITSNSIRQTYNLRVIEQHLNPAQPVPPFGKGGLGGISTPAESPTATNPPPAPLC